ncbi:MAG: hypothetical protein ACJAYU_001330 [Bradymonadia bacterium]|jgi:hypothetical protein
MSALVSDRVVAGGPGDFLTVRHVVLRGIPEQIGSALAEIALRDLGVRKDPWVNPDATREHLAWLERNWPTQRQRALGVAGALGLDPKDFSVDPSCLYYDWAVPGCSNVFWPGNSTADGHSVLSRNYDFTTGTVHELMGAPSPAGARAATSRPFILETYPTGPNAGYASLVVTSYELLGSATDGINSEGLSVALMATVETLRGGGPPPDLANQVGLNEIQLVRFLLEQAATAEQAHFLLKEAPTYVQFVPCHYLIGDRSGRHFVFSPGLGEATLVWGDPERPTCVTNHLEGQMRADIPQRAESVGRLARLRRSVATELDDGRVDGEGMARAARGVAAILPPGEGQYASSSPARTLWHAYYDLVDSAVTIDFYLGDAADGSIRRSEPVRLALSTHH